MRAQRPLFATVFSLLITVGLLCAQVCDLSCSVRACSSMTPASQEAHHRNQSRGCHHHDKNTQSESKPKQDHQAPCQMHGDVVAAMPDHVDGLIAAHHILPPLVAAMPVSM